MPLIHFCIAYYYAGMQILSFTAHNIFAHMQVAKGAHFFSGTTKSGVYNISNVCSTGHQPFLSHSQSITVLQALCDMETDNGGWLVILRRKSDVSPLVNFTRIWVEYEHGFGDLNTEFWYGLKNIHCLTQRDDVELMIELKQNDGTGITWTYQIFTVDGPETNYNLHIGGAEKIEGTGNDNMAYHNNRPFSTIDRDNDEWSSNCAASEDHGNGGGWWFGACIHSALTRPHTGSNKIYWRGTYFPHVEMKIRPKNCLVP